MGIRGFATFIDRQGMVKDHKLHDTEIIIDGLNLAMTLYMRYQNNNTNNHMYGGDYSLWRAHIHTFFNTLKFCNIEPIVVLDGSIDPSLDKFNTKLSRYYQHLRIARKIYKNNYYNEGIIPLMNIFVFVVELRKLGVFLFQTAYEADPVISQISCDLNAPILSNDNDFYIENLPSGIISIRNLLDNFRVFTGNDSSSGSYSYLKCSIFYLNSLKRKFPSINLDLVQVSGLLLGNDYVDEYTSNKLLAKLPKADRPIKGDKRQRNIYNLLLWISKFHDFSHLRHSLSDILRYNDENELICFIDDHFVIRRPTTVEYSTVEDYFLEKSEELFGTGLNMPEYLKKGFMERRIPNRLISICQVHLEFFRPLVEDFHFKDSSYDCVIDLCLYIYGLLRDRDTAIPRIKQYCRDEYEFIYEKVSPYVSIGSRLLPSLRQLEFLTEDERKSLFFNIVSIDYSVLEEIKCYFEDVPFISLSESSVTQFSSMLFAMIYFMQNFEHEIWLEFIYALYVNIILSGHFCPEKVPYLLTLEPNVRTSVLKNLKQFNCLPVLTKTKVYMPRVVHFYNSYQNCLSNLHFLSQVLNIPSVYDIDDCVSTLKGTFIYNLTSELISRPKPLLYLQELLGRDQFPPMSFFVELLNTTLFYSNRDFMLDGDGCDQFMVPECLMNTVPFLNNRYSVEHCILVRSLDVTNRKTHVRSQKLKVNNTNSHYKKKYQN